jgi:hypothetical protein
MHLDFCNKLKIVTRLEFNIFIDTCTQNICIAEKVEARKLFHFALFNYLGTEFGILFSTHRHGVGNLA